MAIKKATPEYLEACTDIAFASSLGQTYYPVRKYLRTDLEKAIQAGEVYVNVKNTRGGGIATLI